MEQVQAGESPELTIGDVTLEWQSKDAIARNSNELPRNLVDTVFTLSTEAGNNLEVAKLGSGDVGVVRLTAVNMPEALGEEELASLKQQLMTNYSQANYQSFIDSLRSAAEVTVNL